MSINPKQFKSLVGRVIKEIPHGYSRETEICLLMCAAHESRLGTFLKQNKGGPALSPWQIEPKTHDTVWEFGDSCRSNAKLLNIEWSVASLEYDLRYSIFIARQRLFMKSEPIPKTLSEIACYLKEHWNTVHGKAKSIDYLEAYMFYYGELS